MKNVLVIHFIIQLISFRQALSDISAREAERIMQDATTACHNVAGLAVAVVSRNMKSRDIARNWTFTKGYGLKDIEHNTPADDRTLLCIGSVTKHMTATLVVHLLNLLRQEKNSQYSVTTLVTDLDESLKFPGSNFNDVTLEDIMSHRTGVAEVFGRFHVGYPEDFTRKQHAQMTARLPRILPNRKAWIYNNNVFATAGYMAEILGEKYFGHPVKWEYLLRHFFFEPLGISNETDFAGYQFHSFDQLANAYYAKKGVLTLADNINLGLIEPGGPAGAVCMSSRAMAAWMEFLMGRGSFKGKQITTREVIEETWKPRISTAPWNDTVPQDKHFSLYALGWGINDYRGIRQIVHQGGIVSYLTTLAIYPDQNISFFMSSSANADHMNDMHLKFLGQLSDKFLSLPPQAYPNCSQPDPEFIKVPDPVNKPEDRIGVHPQNFLGTFRNPLHGELYFLESESGQLLLGCGRVGLAIVECYISKEICFLKFQGVLWYLSESDGLGGENIPVLFKYDSSGRVMEVLMPLYYNEDPPSFKRVKAFDNLNYYAAHSPIQKFFLSISRIVKTILQYVTS